VSGGIIEVGTPLIWERLERFNHGIDHLNERAVSKATVDFLTTTREWDTSFPALTKTRALVRRLCKPTDAEEDALREEALALVAWFGDVAWATEYKRALDRAVAKDDHATLFVTLLHVLRLQGLRHVEFELAEGVESGLKKFLREPPAKRIAKKKPAKKTATRSRGTSTKAKGKK
jgi:hypothetical protein